MGRPNAIIGEVMQAWGDSVGASNSVDMLADPTGDLAKVILTFLI